jgi:hypothetical protein
LSCLDGNPIYAARKKRDPSSCGARLVHRAFGRHAFFCFSDDTFCVIFAPTLALVAESTACARFSIEDKALQVPPAESTPNTTAAQFEECLSTRLFEARLMLTYAAEMGKDLKQDVVAVVANAEDAYARGTWNVDTTKQFWLAYGKLSSIIKPVTGESLVAYSSKALRRKVARVRGFAIVLAFLIIPLSIVTFINTSLLNEVNLQIKDNNDLIVTLRDELTAIGKATDDQKPQIKRDMAITLQQFTGTNRSLIHNVSILNVFGMNLYHDRLVTALELTVPIDDFTEERNKQVTRYQEIRAFAKDIGELNFLLYAAITANFLPVLYAVLGACAFTLRSFSQQLSARTYVPSYADDARFPAAVIAGLVVGLFTNFTQSISLPPLAISFLVGYGVEIFFSFLDAFLETVKKVRSR